MNNSITIRSYNKSDKSSLINLLKLNTPKYFAAEEETDFSNYLDNELDLYYVLFVDDKLVGSGGINFTDNNNTGKLSWDIFHPEYQGKSLGTKLLEFRIEKLKSIENVQKITVRTSQVAYKFYEKNGFELIEIIQNYWAEGFDLYNMKYNHLKLNTYVESPPR